MRFQKKRNRYQEERSCIYDIAGESHQKGGQNGETTLVSGAFHKVDMHGKGSKEKGREKAHGTLES
jgi:hypothetical protein